MNVKNYPVNIESAVRWGEMDALGHVNNAVYFRYFEDVRLAYFERLGFRSVVAGEKIGPILAQIDCSFRRPVVYPDTLTIGAWVSKIGNTSLQLQYEIYSRRQQTVVATGSSVVVMMDYERGEKIPVTEEIKAAVEALQGPRTADGGRPTADG